MTFELKDTTIRSELVAIELKPTVNLSLSDISFPLNVSGNQQVIMDKGDNSLY